MTLFHDDKDRFGHERVGEPVPHGLCTSDGVGSTVRSTAIESPSRSPRNAERPLSD